MAASSRFSSPEVLSRIKKLSLRAKHAVHGTMAGLNRSPLLGQSIEFVDYREYVPGDDLKKLDWRVYARTNRWCVKLFEEESNLRGHLVLDGSTSMRYGSGPLDKYEYAATLVASMATLLIEQRDAASLQVFDDDERAYLPPSTSQVQLRKIVERLEMTEPDRTTQLGEILARKADEIPTRGVVLIVSDLLTDLDAFYDALGRLRYRGHEVVIFHLLDPDELELPFEGQIEFHDLEAPDRLMVEPKYFRQAYRQAMRAFCHEVEARSGDFGAEYLLVRTDQDLGLALSFWLHRRERILGRGRQGAGAYRLGAARRARQGGGA